VPPTDGERLATIEQVLRDLRGDVGDLRQEGGRTRERLHAIEATARGLALVQTQRIEQQERQWSALARRLRVLSVVIALAGVAVAVVGLLLHTT